jgi:hypothetical protein
MVDCPSIVFNMSERIGGKFLCKILRQLGIGKCDVLLILIMEGLKE